VIDVRIDQRQLPGSVRSISIDERAVTHVRLIYPGAAGGRLMVRPAVAGRLARGHRQLLPIRAEDGRLLGDRMLDAWDQAVAVSIDRPADTAAAPLRFVILGMGHIWTGYDHLLFLAALFAGVRGWRGMLQTITSFTVAHSITLALATTGLLHAPGRIVEALIAASIVYVGFENLIRTAPSSRWKPTFAFGLIHGLGLAGALRDLGIGDGSAAIALPLASFNAGVEAGQLAIAAVLVPLFWRLNARSGPRLQFASVWAVLVIMAGTYWLIERLV
jgi:hypothetical protein